MLNNWQLAQNFIKFSWYMNQQCDGINGRTFISNMLYDLGTMLHEQESLHQYRQFMIRYFNINWSMYRPHLTRIDLIVIVIVLHFIARKDFNSTRSLQLSFSRLDKEKGCVKGTNWEASDRAMINTHKSTWDDLKDNIAR